ncbi:MAG: hypothetical protein M3Y77_00845 [Actinomycetota bacterium]|nr:hypothetical protein [Actinomycetota bacterium]
MSTRSRSLVAAVAAAVLLLAGCATKTAGVAETSAAASAGALQAAGGSPGSSPAGGQTGTGSTASGSPGSSPAGGQTGTGSTASGSVAVDPQAWAQKLDDGMKRVTSLTGSAAVDGAIKETAIVKETLDGGRLKAADIAMTLVEGGSSVPMSLRLISGKAYLGGAAIISLIGSKAAGKQWVLLAANSSDPSIAAIGKALGPMQQLAGTDSYVYFAKAAKSITMDGKEKVGSFDATKYQVDIDLTKIAAVLPPELKDYGQQIAASGMKDINSTYWIDDQNRLVKAVLGLTVQGVTQRTTVTIDAFNLPVTIEAPAAATVYTG